MQFFSELGSQVERRWKEQNYNESVFPDIAAQALSEASTFSKASPWEIVRWLFNATHIPTQHDIPGDFGNPPITLFSGPRFVIDVYFWLDGTTSIHQHAFCGAFEVLLGSSIHSSYAFEPRQDINQHFIVGDLVLQSVELLEQGRVKQIAPGNRYVHALFHLDRPSATICIRTIHTASGAPQYSYYKPYFAIDPFFREPQSIKQAQSAELLLKMRHPETDAMLSELLGGSDFQSAYNILGLAGSYLTAQGLEKSFGVTAGEDRFQNLVEVARRRHGKLVDLIIPVLREMERQNELVHRRGRITSNEHRFFLALLLNVPDRKRLLELVQQRFPETDPVETVTAWVEELAATKVWSSPEPNVLGIPGIGDDYLFVFQCLLKGFSLEETRSAFSSEFSEDYLESLADKPQNLYEAIRGSLLFKSIFVPEDRIG